MPSFDETRYSPPIVVGHRRLEVTPGPAGGEYGVSWIARREPCLRVGAGIAARGVRVAPSVRQQSRSRAAMGPRSRSPRTEGSRGRRGSRGRTWRRAATSRRRPRWPQERQTRDAYDAEPMLPVALQCGTIGARAVRPGLYDTKPVVPFRPRVGRQLVGVAFESKAAHCRELVADHIWQSGNWTCTEAASGWSQASMVGYGSARGATAAHRRSDG
jgi:hypothetical protein